MSDVQTFTIDEMLQRILAEPQMDPNKDIPSVLFLADVKDKLNLNENQFDELSSMYFSHMDKTFKNFVTTRLNDTKSNLVNNNVENSVDADKKRKRVFGTDNLDKWRKSIFPRIRKNSSSKDRATELLKCYLTFSQDNRSSSKKLTGSAYKLWSGHIRPLGKHLALCCGGDIDEFLTEYGEFSQNTKLRCEKCKNC